MLSADISGLVLLWDIGTDKVIQRCDFGGPLKVVRRAGETIFLAGRHVKVWRLECTGGHDGVEDLADKQYLLQKMSDEAEKSTSRVGKKIFYETQMEIAALHNFNE